MQMKNYLKREKGSMAVYTIASILSFIIILTGIFFTAASVRKNQLRTLMKIKEVYGKTVSTRRDIYDEKTAVEDTDAYIKDGLILHYDAINNTGAGHSNNTTTWKDLSGSGNDGKLYNIGGTSTSGWESDGLVLDGIDDYVEIDPSKLTNLQQGTVCVDFEIYDWNSSQLYDTVFVKGNELDWVHNHIQISEYSSTATKFSTTISDNTNSTAGSLTVPAVIYEHKQIVLEWDGTQVRNFNNGELYQTISSTIYPADDSTECYLGRNYGSSARYLNGKIKSLKIYNRFLSAEEIKQNYEIDKQRYQIVDDTSYVSSGLITHYDAINNTGTGYSNTATIWKDLSGRGNDGTLLGFDSSSGWKNNYLKFDGVDDYVLSTNNLGLSGDTALTMCAVAAWDGDSWLSDWPSYMGITSASSYAGLSMTMNGGQPALDFWNYRYRADNALSVKQIYQICLVKEPGSINTTSKIYVNGQEVTGTGNSTSSPSIVNSQAVVGRLDSTRWANARIYNIKYYNRALSQSEIQKNYAIDQQRYGF